MAEQMSAAERRYDLMLQARRAAAPSAAHTLSAQLNRPRRELSRPYTRPARQEAQIIAIPHYASENQTDNAPREAQIINFPHYATRQDEASAESRAAWVAQIAAAPRSDYYGPTLLPVQTNRPIEIKITAHASPRYELHEKLSNSYASVSGKINLAHAAKAAAGVAGAASIAIAVPHIGSHLHHGHSNEAHLVVSQNAAMPRFVIEAPSDAAPVAATQSDSLIAAPVTQTPQIKSQYSLAARIAVDAAEKEHLFPVMSKVGYMTHSSVSEILAMVDIESGENIKATSKESSSVGLLQILDRTFLEMADWHWSELRGPVATTAPHLVPVMDLVASSVREAKHHTKAGHDYLPRAKAAYHKKWAHLPADQRKFASGDLIKDIKRARENPHVTLGLGFTEIQQEMKTLPEDVVQRLGYDGAARCLHFLGRPHTITLGRASANARARSVLPKPIFTRNHIDTNIRVKELIAKIREPYTERIQAIDVEMWKRPELQPYAVKQIASAVPTFTPMA